MGTKDGASAVTSKVGTTVFNSAIITYFSTPPLYTFYHTVESYPLEVPYIATSV
ncbi:MAG: hypothetical protein J6I85_05670 [Clostridia bacterium]|nr:hypothetical protein [Clostridia bacterium]